MPIRYSGFTICNIINHFVEQYNVERILAQLMESEVFRAGTRHIAPSTSEEIKILICYILTETGASMSFSQIHEALTEGKLVNYFELVPAIDSLVLTGHISRASNKSVPDIFMITELGRETAAAINTLLPLSVREAAKETASRLLRRQKREREVEVKITEARSGFDVRLALPDDKGQLASFTLFCPTREEAELVRRRFLNDPVYIYKGVIALLTGDRDVLGEMFPTDDELF